MTYSTTSGCIITEASAHPVTLYTESEMDYVDPGKLVTDENGSRFKIAEVRYISGKLYRVTLLPLEVSNA
ncbi:hypothetical protein [Geomonas edaphica]|uniref:hypothetical protein n=1 Tax=Geomonas edaphica TaxID=2570226 RepID=UPI0010A7F91D|nr:hypothetical protein [Geomonas edaphica]